MKKQGAANFASVRSVGIDEDTVKKLRKLEVLAESDKETIEVLQKKMNAMRGELEQFK